MTTNPSLGDQTNAIHQAAHDEVMAEQNETYMRLYVDNVKLSATLELSNMSVSYFSQNTPRQEPEGVQETITQ